MNPLEVLFIAVMLLSIFGMTCVFIKDYREKKSKTYSSVSKNRYVVDDIISIDDMKKMIERSPALRERIAGYMI
jgi:hypothetical protein